MQLIKLTIGFKIFKKEDTPKKGLDEKGRSMSVVPDTSLFLSFFLSVLLLSLFLLVFFILPAHLPLPPQSLSTSRNPNSSLPVIIEPGQEAGGVPVGSWCLPVPVRPDDLRLILVHQLIQLWHCLLLSAQHRRMV